ncbi:MAG: aminotransferase class V-fold PLP-dependent enzyme [Oscillospiraceae bacterium]|nr:aminotransferase class V-fold PLP-dependent enzyme [Oscillospiraceae bacterium]
MIYFDNAATTYPKPDSVVRGLSEAARYFGGNPGRSGHAMSMRTAAMVYDTRKKAAELFNLQAENVVFTLNCTHALNMAIKGAVRPRGHVVLSCLEHNSVLRPVYALSKTAGVSYSVVRPERTDEETVQAFERQITPQTQAIICTHASNLSGKIMPVERLSDLCRARGILLIVDAAQSAGVLPIDLKRLGRCVVCMAGHKGLYGASGTGMMLLGDGVSLSTILEGGTGSVSNQLEQPDFMPDRFESGTVNTAGIFSLSRGMDFVRRHGINWIYRHEMAACIQIFGALTRNPNLRVLDPGFRVGTHVPVISFVHNGMDSGEVGERLNRAGIAVRSGLHCAPLAHEFYHSHETGAVRISPSAFTTRQDTETLIREVKKM